MHGKGLLSGDQGQNNQLGTGLYDHCVSAGGMGNILKAILNDEAGLHNQHEDQVEQVNLPLRLGDVVVKLLDGGVLEVQELEEILLFNQVELEFIGLILLLVIEVLLDRERILVFLNLRVSNGVHSVLEGKLLFGKGTPLGKPPVLDDILLGHFLLQSHVFLDPLNVDVLSLDFFQRLVHHRLYFLRGFPEEVIDRLLSLSLHFGYDFLHLQLFAVIIDSFEQLIGLFTQHDVSICSGGANSRGRVDGVSDQGKLRLVVAYHSHHASARMNADFDLDLIPVVVLVLVNDLHHAERQFEHSLNRGFLSQVFLENFLSEGSARRCDVGVADCFDLLNSVVFAENVEVSVNSVEEHDNVIFEGREDLSESTNVEEEDDDFSCIVCIVGFLDVEIEFIQNERRHQVLQQVSIVVFFLLESEQQNHVHFLCANHAIPLDGEKGNDSDGEQKGIQELEVEAVLKEKDDEVSDVDRNSHDAVQDQL